MAYGLGSKQNNADINSARLLEGCMYVILRRICCPILLLEFVTTAVGCLKSSATIAWISFIAQSTSGLYIILISVSIYLGIVYWGNTSACDLLYS